MTLKPDIKPTKERLYMEFASYYGIDMIQRHINRYKWAMSHLRKTDDVLDAACGSGYGSSIILNACQSVMGIDKSREAIQYASWKKQKTGHKNLEFAQVDLGTGFDLDRKFDTIVCIETIEHLTENEQYMFLSRMKWILRDNGKLLITTPKKKQEPMTEFHEKEFTPEDFMFFLKTYFNFVVFEDNSRYMISDDFILAVCSEVIR